MSRLEIPVNHRILFSTGDICLWMCIELQLKDVAGNFIPDVFLVDSGAEITTYPAFEAKRMGLPMPQKAAVGAIHSQTGLEVRSGVLRFRIAGMDPTEYAVTCLFVGDPDTPPAAGTSAGKGSLPRLLLQPLGLLDRLRFAMEKDTVTGSAYGDLVVERK